MSKQLTGGFNDELIPAYNRVYTNKPEVTAAFKSGKDFVLARTGQLCSIRDFARGSTVIIRYDRLRKVCTLAIPHTTQGE